MKMNSRRIEFENIKNARDLGGLYTEDGHMITSGLLIRSENLAGASEADIFIFVLIDHFNSSKGTAPML